MPTLRIEGGVASEGAGIELAPFVGDWDTRRTRREARRCYLWLLENLPPDTFEALRLFFAEGEAIHSLDRDQWREWMATMRKEAA